MIRPLLPGSAAEVTSTVMAPADWPPGTFGSVTLTRWMPLARWLTYTYAPTATAPRNTTQAATETSTMRVLRRVRAGGPGG